ncbi:MAG: hypothetical protein KDJ64_11200, partial [Nitratireductor sp.]|nr:hypothetical protein [Nitratireductor sp.]
RDGPIEAIAARYLDAVHGTRSLPACAPTIEQNIGLSGAFSAQWHNCRHYRPGRRLPAALTARNPVLKDASY